MADSTKGTTWWADKRGARELFHCTSNYTF